MRPTPWPSMLVAAVVAACASGEEAPAEADGVRVPAPESADGTAEVARPIEAPSTTAPNPTEMPTAGSESEPLPCRAPEGVSSSPRSIAAVVDLVNALPRPATVACFLEALERPLGLYATSGVFSAQPANGRRSPRIFLFLDPLIVSVAPEGDGKDLLEMGELVSNTRSLKAEIEFPVVADLDEEAPFERLLYADDVTNCAFCHAAEEPSESIAFTQAFVSNALRPIPSEKVTVEELRVEREACMPEQEPERCSMLSAIFDGGEVVPRDFPSEMATFY